METVQSWLRSLNLEHHAEAIFGSGITSMLKVVRLKDEDLLSMGLTNPADRQAIIESIANINNLNNAATTQEVGAYSTRDTKDPKLVKSLLELVSELFSNSNKGSRHRVVIDKVERVRNEPLSLSFKRLLKSLSSQDVIQRLYFPVAADTQMRKQHEQQGQQQQQYSAEEEQILSSGFASSSVSGPFGNGVYFPCTFTVFKPSAVFRVIVCDVAVGKSLIYDESGAVVPSLQDGLFDSVSYSPGLVSRSNAAVKEDLVIKSPVQACPRFVVTFSLHSTDASRGIRVVSADGLGDHRSIQEALDAAASGDLILLRPNTYCESLHISKDVQLMASLGGVAVLEGVLTIASSCQLSGLHVRLTGGSSVDNSVAVAVEGGSPALANCDVAGMVTVANAAQLVLRDCRVHDSAKHGVHVAARSTCLVEKCTIDTMAECGVQVDAGGRGVIMNSSVTKCLQNGIYLLDGAKGVIEGCNISGCSYPGIAVSSADPVITRNRIHHNERSGLVIAGRSDDNTLVEDNNIFSNGRDGVMIAKDAVCLFQGNAIFDNKGSGVQITTGANPQFVKTHVYSNKDSGIVISKGGNAHISECQIFANVKSGISVAKGGTGSVLVDGCDVFSNTMVGVEILPSSAAKIVHNRIFQQSVNVSVDKKATPTIQSNEIFAGKVSGLQLQDSAEATISANTLYSNTVSVTGASPAIMAQLKQSNKVL